MQSWRTWRALGILVVFLFLVVVGSAYLINGAHTGFSAQDSGSQAAGALNQTIEGVRDVFGFEQRVAKGGGMLIKSEVFALDGVNTLSIDTSSDDVTVTIIDQDELSVDWYGDASILPEETFIIEQQGDRVSIIGQKRPLLIGISLGGQRMEVGIPKAYANQLFVDNSSGNVTFLGDFTLTMMHTNISSGNIKLEGSLNIPDISLKSSSGDIRLSGHVQADVFKTKSSSGNQQFQSLYAKEYDLDAGSGNVTATLGAGSGNIKVASGNINIGLLDGVQAAKAKAGSGNVRVQIDTSLGFDVTADTSSGDIKGNVALTYHNKRENSATASVQGAQMVRVEAQTASGNVRIDHMNLK